MIYTMNNNTYFIGYPTLKGVQKVFGISFPKQWFDREQRRGLLIKSWFIGCSIYRFEQGDLLKFATPKTLNCNNLDGWPLVLENGILTSTQFVKKPDAEIMNYDLVIVMGNDINCYRYEDAVHIDPADWIDLTEYQLSETDSYNINIVYDELSEDIEESKSIEQILAGKIPRPNRRMLAFVNSQHNGIQQEKDKQYNKYHQEPSITKRNLILPIFILLILLMAILIYFNFKLFSLETRLSQNLSKISSFILLTSFYVVTILLGIKIIKFLYNLPSKVKQANFPPNIVAKNFSYNIKAGDLQATPNLNYSTLPSRANRKKSVLSQWRHYATLFALVSKLSHLVAFRQGKYIDTMIKKLEKGDLMDALRYAIPINGDQPPTGQSFGVPKPREKLSLNESVYGNSLAINLDQQLKNYLQQLYRQSATKLIQQKKIEAAVYVLVELLNNLKEGIECLEQHKMYKQAMELAIARNANTAWIVKLCCLANDWHTAIMIARRDHAFASAIIMLEKEQREIANKLRVEWANTLAEKAEWLAAIDVIWPLTEYRYLAEQWLCNVDNFNAKAIVKRFILMPDSINKLEECLMEIKTNASYYQTRLEIAYEILEQQKYIDKLRGLLRIMINHILVDAITYPNRFTKSDISALIKLTQDKALQVDLPLSSLNRVKQKSLLETSNVIRYHCPDKGQKAIFAMIPLTNNNFLLALGELGIIQVNKQGKQLAHFMIVADSFVVSANRLQVLALIKRDNYYRIHKLDLSTGSIVDLGVIKFDLCCWEFDGINWTIIKDNCLEIIDISDKLSVVWRVDFSPNSVKQIAMNINYKTILTLSNENKYEAFCYSLPEHCLIKRIDINEENNKIFISHDSDIMKMEYNRFNQQLRFRFSDIRYCSEFPLKIVQKQFDNLLIYSTGRLMEFMALIIQRIDESGYDIHLFYPCNKKICMTIEWNASTKVSCSYIGDEYCFFDDQGRALHVNVTENKVTSFSV